jgi:molybdenum cofactor guanylyltransferase
MAPLYGLVLAGGKSQRMGTDKTKMKWHGKEQRYWIADLIKECCANVFISCRAEQMQEIEEHNYKTIKDEFEGTGPLGAIVSAYTVVPAVAWLVVACDLPFVDTDTIQHLIKHRNPNVMATAYQSPADNLPEPLIAIWEPQAGRALVEQLKQNKFSLREILLQQDVFLVPASDAVSLINVNCIEDVEMVKHEKNVWPNQGRNLNTPF